MASIKKIQDGKYFIRVSKGRGKNRRYINTTVRGTLKDAKTAARQKETLLDMGYTPDEITLTFEGFIKRWLKAIKPKVSPRTHAGYAEYIERYAAKQLNPLKLSDIKRHHIQSVYDAMTERGLSPTTVRHLNAALRAAFNYAIKKETLRANPCTSIDLPARVRPHIEVLSIDEAAVFVGHCQTMRNGLIFEFALETGMRPEEYLALRWRDLDLTRNTASVSRVVVFARKGGGYTFDKPKTAKSRRKVPISADLRERLIRHKREQNEYILSSKLTYAPNDLVFADTIGNPYPVNNLTRRHFRPIMDACGFGRHITLYCLRHTCATILLIMGVNPKVVADRLGHSSVTLTLDTYSHVLPDIQESATESISNVLRMRAK